MRLRVMECIRNWKAWNTFFPRAFKKSMTLLKKNIYIYIFCCCCWVRKSCLTLCNPMNCSPQSASVHGISQARILDWVAISFSRGSSWSRDQTRVSCIAGRFFTTEPPGKYIYVFFFPDTTERVYIYLYLSIYLSIYIWSESFSVVSNSCDTMDCIVHEIL